MTFNFHRSNSFWLFLRQFILRLVFGREQKNPVLLYNNFIRKAFVTWQEGGVLLSRQITVATRPLCTPPCAPRQTCAVQDKCVPNTGSKLKYCFKFRLKRTQYMKFYRIDSLDRQTNFSFSSNFFKQFRYHSRYEQSASSRPLLKFSLKCNIIYDCD